MDFTDRAHYDRQLRQAAQESNRHVVALKELRARLGRLETLVEEQATRINQLEEGE